MKFFVKTLHLLTSPLLFFFFFFAHTLRCHIALYKIQLVYTLISQKIQPHRCLIKNLQLVYTLTVAKNTTSLFFTEK